MEIDRRGRVVSHRIVNSAIISRFRMTYRDVNAILEEDDPILIRKYADIYSDLKEMEALAEVLRDVRFKKGSIDFDIEEGKIVPEQRWESRCLSVSGSGEPPKSSLKSL